MLNGIEVRLNCDFFVHRKELQTVAKTIVFTGMIDQYYDYCFGELEYRSLRFEEEILDVDNYQGNAVVNYMNMKFRIHALLNISILNLAHNLKQLLLENIQQLGVKVMNPTIQ